VGSTIVDVGANLVNGGVRISVELDSPGRLQLDVLILVCTKCTMDGIDVTPCVTSVDV